MSRHLKKKFVFISGPHLTQLRGDSGMDQADLGRKIDHSRQTISTWENKAKVKLKIEVAEKLAGALNVPFDDLTKVKTFQEKTSFKDKIFEGDYVGMHNRVWTQHELTMSTQRELLKDLVTTVKNLTHGGNGQ